MDYKDNAIKEILNIDSAFSKLFVDKGSAYAFSHYLTKDAIMLPQNKELIIGIKAIYDSMNKPGSKDILSWKPKGGKVAQSGELGHIWGVYTLSLADGNKIDGKYLNIWIKVSGNWKVAGEYNEVISNQYIWIH